VLQGLHQNDWMSNIGYLFIYLPTVHRLKNSERCVFFQDPRSPESIEVLVSALKPDIIVGLIHITEVASPNININAM
jgi:hypothetical protein